MTTMNIDQPRFIRTLTTFFFSQHFAQCDNCFQNANKIATLFHYINNTKMCAMQQFPRCGETNQKSTQHNNQAWMVTQQTSGGDNTNLHHHH